MKNLLCMSSSLVMFGAVWQYVDRSNELTKEHITTHMLLGQLEVEKKEREKGRRMLSRSSRRERSGFGLTKVICRFILVMFHSKLASMLLCLHSVQ